MVNSHAPLDIYTFHIYMFVWLPPQKPEGASIVFALHLMMIIVVEFAMPFSTRILIMKLLISILLEKFGFGAIKKATAY